MESSPRVPINTVSILCFWFLQYVHYSQFGFEELKIYLMDNNVVLCNGNRYNKIVYLRTNLKASLHIKVINRFE